MTKATQGPYSVGATNKTSVYSSDCIGSIIAHCSGFRVRDMVSLSEEEEQATAHLLAASWDMYHALDRTLKELEASSVGYPGVTKGTWGAALKALAKARGE